MAASTNVTKRHFLFKNSEFHNKENTQSDSRNPPVDIMATPPQCDPGFQNLEVTVDNSGTKVVIKECRLGTGGKTNIENLKDTAREMHLDRKTLPTEDNLTKCDSTESHTRSCIGGDALESPMSVEGIEQMASSDKSNTRDVDSTLAGKTNLTGKLAVSGCSVPITSPNSNTDKGKLHTVLYSCSKCKFCTNKLSELKAHAQTEQHKNSTADSIKDEPQSEKDAPQREKDAPQSDKDAPQSDMAVDNTKTGDGTTIHTCSSCTFKTPRFHAYKEHLLTHAKIGAKELFKCTDCDYSTRHKYNLKTHLKRHAKIGELCEDEVFRCPKCEYVSPYKHDLMTHVKKHDPQKPFQCEQCDFKSIYKHSLIHHVRSKHEKQRPYKCSKCDYTSARKQDLQTHMGRHAEEKKFKCDRCDYATPYRVSFKAHMDKHMGNKLFKCEQEGCTFATTTKQNLKSHELRHAAVKPLKCQFCDYTAAHKQQMLTHEQKHGLIDSPSKIFRCTYCNYETTHRYSLQRHMNRHQTDRKMPDKKHVCEECGYSTGYKSSLKRHMAKHSDVKPFKCGHCEYSAINMTQMHVHIAKHTGIKPFKCDICEYATANKQHLVGHMAKHSTVRLNCPKCSFSTAWKQRLRMHLKAHETGTLFQKKDQSSIQTNQIVYVTSNSGDIDEALTAESEAALSEISSAIEAFHSYSLQGEVEVTSSPTIQDQENGVISAASSGQGEEALLEQIDNGTSHAERIQLIDEDGNQTLALVHCVNGKSSADSSSKRIADVQKNNRAFEVNKVVPSNKGIRTTALASKSSGESECENSELVIDEMKKV